jgi:acetate CoA/acetoacetate CoA-transferase beta subunit
MRPRESPRSNLPLTSATTIDLVVTDMAVIGFPGGRATLMETAPGLSVADVVANTEAELVVPTIVPKMVI